MNIGSGITIGTGITINPIRQYFYRQIGSSLVFTNTGAFVVQPEYTFFSDDGDFATKTVRYVGPGGYESLDAATLDGTSNLYIFIAPIVNTTTEFVYSNNVNIYLANSSSEFTKTIRINSNVSNPWLAVYGGNTRFNITNNSSAGIIYNYSNTLSMNITTSSIGSDNIVCMGTTAQGQDSSPGGTDIYVRSGSTIRYTVFACQNGQYYGSDTGNDVFFIMRGPYWQGNFGPYISAGTGTDFIFDGWRATSNANSQVTVLSGGGSDWYMPISPTINVSSEFRCSNTTLADFSATLDSVDLRYLKNASDVRLAGNTGLTGNVGLTQSSAVVRINGYKSYSSQMTDIDEFTYSSGSRILFLNLTLGNSSTILGRGNNSPYTQNIRSLTGDIEQYPINIIDFIGMS